MSVHLSVRLSVHPAPAPAPAPAAVLAPKMKIINGKMVLDTSSMVIVPDKVMVIVMVMVMVMRCDAIQCGYMHA